MSFFVKTFLLRTVLFVSIVFGVSFSSSVFAASCTISPVDLGGGSYRMDYTIDWSGETYTLMEISGAGSQPYISKTGSTQSGNFTHTPTITTTYQLTPYTGFSPGYLPLCEATVTITACTWNGSTS
ncbi:MAG: hypothetical protein KC736_01630, partial [Candidatus Moranbacteria bacterium]|nr:hypothetical protein [Candidatus Moranbacteria bacterium]